MSEEKKNEVLGQEKELDESEMEAVSGGKSEMVRCIGSGVVSGGESWIFSGIKKEEKCSCGFAGNGDY